MAESAALLVDEVLPQRAMRQWVLSVPYQLRFVFAYQPKVSIVDVVFLYLIRFYFAFIAHQHS